MMNEDELLLARIHSAHHAKPRANVIAALSDEYPLTAEHERALVGRRHVLWTVARRTISIAL